MPNTLETLSALIAACGIALTARRSMWGWPISLIATILYGWIFYTAHLYADAILQSIFCISIVYGWWLWLHDCRHKTSTRNFIEQLPSRPLYFYSAFKGIIITSIITWIWCLSLQRWSDDPTPILDASLSSASLLAQIWTAQRYRESWLLWALIDLIYIGLFISRALYPTAVLYGGFVAIALYGYWTWHPTSRSPP